MTEKTFSQDQFRHTKRITGINYIGVQTLIKREVDRFINVYTQTIVAPVVTTLMFFAVFALAFGGNSRQVEGIPLMQFLAPGLIMMAMVQNAFANTSSSLVISKVQGNIVDILMPPLSAGEILFGFLTGSVLRGLVVGMCTLAVLSLFVSLSISHLWAVIIFPVLGTLMLGSLGLAAGIWSEKFDHIAAVTNFIVTPMTFLSGTFYSITILPDIWQRLTLFNPFFYMIDGFRYAFTGHADGNIFIGLAVLCACDIGLVFLSYKMIKSGYKIKS